MTVPHSQERIMMRFSISLLALAALTIDCREQYAWQPDPADTWGYGPTQPPPQELGVTPTPWDQTVVYTDTNYTFDGSIGNLVAEFPTGSLYTPQPVTPT